MQCRNRGANHINIVIHCKYGKHKSVAFATMLAQAMCHYEQVHVELEHLSRSNWSRRGCGHVPCRQCDQLGTEKKAVMTRVMDMFDNVFERDGWFI